LTENSSNNLVGVITTLFKKGLNENNSKKVVGVITTLFKKGLNENNSKNVVSVIKRRNGCSKTETGLHKNCERTKF